MIRRSTLLLVLLVGLVTPVRAGAQSELDETRRDLDAARAAVDDAAAEVDRAQALANRSAETLFAALSEQEELAVEVAEIERRIESAEADLSQLSEEVQAIVVDQYVEGTHGTSVLEAADLNASARAAALSRYVASTRLDAVDEYRLAHARLDDLRLDLAERRGRQTALVSELESARAEAEAGLAELTAVRSDLDEQVAVLEAEEARLVAAEEARRAAEEEARRAAEEEARRAAEEEARLRAEEEAQGAPTPTATPVAPEATSEPTPSGEPEPEAPSGADPSPATGWVCPVAGPTSFIDSWGAPRAVGRWHQGTDMMADEGIPVVAVVDGTVEHRGNSIGGLSAHLNAADGTYFYYTHLSGYENEGAGSVAQGTVIGYVGMTGNAPVPHLHFEHHPGGRGNPVNPYPTLIASC